MSETNQDRSSKATNMPLQALMPTPLPNPKPEKPGKFDGTEFKRWQQKILFYLTTLHLAKFLQEDPPESGTDRDSVLTVDAWTQGKQANECRCRLKKNKKNHPQAKLTNHASPSLSAVVSEVNLTTNNKDW